MLLPETPTHVTVRDFPKHDPTNDNVAVSGTADTAGGLLSGNVLSAGTSMDATVIKASAGRLYFLYGINLDATALAFIKIYDKATAPDPSADSALLKWQVYLPPTPTSPANNKPIILPLALGMVFENGISFVLTTGAGTDETSVGANDVSVQYLYI